MHKTSTPLSKTELLKTKTKSSAKEMQPSEETLSLILQFAASYRAEKTVDNQYVDLNLN